MGQREHPTFRHPPKTQILREDRLSRLVYREHSCGEFWEEMFPLEQQIMPSSVEGAGRLVAESTKPARFLIF
jgi:hypothetical protein